VRPFSIVVKQEFFRKLVAPLKKKLTSSYKKDKNFSYSGISSDIGILYVYRPASNSFLNTFFQAQKFQFGLSVQDINQPSIAVNGDLDAAIPPIIQGGIAYFHEVIMFSLGVRLKEDITQFQFGVEYKLFDSENKLGKNLFFVRAGIVPEFQENTGSDTGFGFGYNVGSFSIDYGFGYSLNLIDVGGSHKFSIEYAF